MDKKGKGTNVVGLKYGFRSGLEEKVGADILQKEGKVEYEQLKISYMVPEKKHSYKPDFQLSNGIIIETKGRFLLLDRQKHLLIKKQHPELDIRFVFTNPNALLRKGAKSTYADFCIKHGFLFAKGSIPGEWYDED